MSLDKLLQQEDQESAERAPNPPSDTSDIPEHKAPVHLNGTTDSIEKFSSEEVLNLVMPDYDNASVESVRLRDNIHRETMGFLESERNGTEVKPLANGKVPHEDISGTSEDHPTLNEGTSHPTSHNALPNPSTSRRHHYHKETPHSSSNPKPIHQSSVHHPVSHDGHSISPSITRTRHFHKVEEGSLDITADAVIEELEKRSAPELHDRYSDSLISHQGPMIHRRGTHISIAKRIEKDSENMKTARLMSRTLPVAKGDPDEAFLKRLTSMSPMPSDDSGRSQDKDSADISSSNHSNTSSHLSASSSVNEVELAHHLLADHDSGWKLDRRDSGHLFWRRDSSVLNGIDPRSRVKFRYEVEVCEFETRSSSADDLDSDDESEVFDSEDELLAKGDNAVNPIEASAPERSDENGVIGSKAVVCAIAIVMVIIGIFYRWLTS